MACPFYVDKTCLFAKKTYWCNSASSFEFDCFIYKILQENLDLKNQLTEVKEDLCNQVLQIKKEVAELRDDVHNEEELHMCIDCNNLTTNLFKFICFELNIPIESKYTFHTCSKFKAKNSVIKYIKEVK